MGHLEKKKKKGPNEVKNLGIFGPKIFLGGDFWAPGFLRGGKPFRPKRLN